MKPTFFSLAALLLVASSPGIAEEAAPQPFVPVTLAPETQGVSFPFEFSVTPRKWSQARTGKLFSTGVYSADFVLPSLKEAPTPIRYPRWAVREGWEGSFVIAIEVRPTGEVGRWKVTQSTGYRLLDETATHAVRHWKFHPATEKGRAVVSCIQIPIHFELQ